MEFIKRFFKSNKTPTPNQTLFGSSKSELKELLVSIGDLTVGNDFLKIDNYPFEPSIAYHHPIIKANQIDELNSLSYPPTIKVGNELIFLTREKKDELEAFASRNNVAIVVRPIIWSWILEPFLDTEYTPEIDEKAMEFLGNYGLTAEQVKSLRTEVQTQMMKYNFDTMLWEWVSFDTSDVLKAMRPAYSRELYRDFYSRVMEIALFTKKGK